MINKSIKEAFSQNKLKIVASNFLSLSLLQGLNLILPLITFPYLVKVLGVEKYGLVFFAQAFITYFSVLTDYGFNLSGTREISENRNDSRKIKEIFNAILTARLGLALLGFLLMGFVVLLFNRFSQNWELYFLTYGMVIGNSIFPIWFFQGIEKMKYITIISLVSKIFFTILIFIFVHTSKDFLYVPILNSCGYIFIGISSLILVRKKFKIRFEISKFSTVKTELKKGWSIFISRISINLYTATTTFILGLVTNNTTVGYYVIAEKVIKIIVAFFAPLNQALYPYIINLRQQSSEKCIKVIKKLLLITFILTSFLWIFLFTYAPEFFHTVFSREVEHSIKLFRFLSPLIIINPIAAVLFNIILLTYKMDRHFLRIYLSGAFLNIILLTLLLFILELSTVGAAIALLTCEIFITFYALIIIHKSDLEILKFKKKLHFEKAN